MHLILIRHGQSHMNLPGFEPTQPAEWDSPLTPTGHEQARRLATWLVKEIPHVDKLYASSLSRAHQTAQYVSQAYGMPIELEPRLREFTQNARDHSAYPNDQLPTQYVSGFYYENPFTSRVLDRDDGETWLHVRSRVGMLMEEFVLKHAGQTLVLISHGGVINAFLDNALNIGPYRACDIWIKNTGVTSLEFVDNLPYERWRLHYTNRLDHLVGAAHLVT